MTDEPNIPDRDELHDRLIDCGLEELVGGAKAPDLRERILAAAQATPVGDATRAEMGGGAYRENRRFAWAALAVAVCLLVATVGGLILPSLQPAREAAEMDAANSRPFSRLTATGTPAPAVDEDAAGDEVPGQQKQVRLEIGAAAEQQILLEQSAPAPGAALADEEVMRQLAAMQASSSRPSEGQTNTEELMLGVGVNSDAGEVGEIGDDDLTRELVTVAPRADELGDLAVEQRYAQQASEAVPAPRASLALGWEGEGRGSARGRTSAGKGTAVDLAALPALNPAQAAAPMEESLAWHDSRYGDGQASADYDSYRLGEGKELRDLGDIAELDRQPYFSLGWHRNYSGGGDRYAEIVDNPFHAISAATTDNRLSTFSIDVDTASYANVRQFLMQGNTLPPPDAVRIEELINYFDYDYAGPGEAAEPMAWNAVMAQAQIDAARVPFAANVEVAACPWAPKHRLVRFGIKGREIARTQRPKSNLVFLVDVSGSMDDPQKLPLLVEGMRMLTRELGENDRVAIVVYASTEGLALDSTRGDQQEKIMAALDRLSAGGSTAGGAGIQLAYKVAAQNFIEGGVNRVILCTDGDFNVGVTDVEALQQLAADKAKDTGVFLTVLGFGRGNLNDALMEAVADHGNGNYHYVDNRSEARKVLVEEMAGTLVTIAKDVKIQIEFNPAKVAGYRLIGYENRVLAAKDFNDDTKDAGEIGAGHTVTALYEIVPAGQTVGAPATDDLKYSPAVPPSRESEAAAESAPEKYNAAESSDELLTLKIRYKQPDGDESTKLEFPATDGGQVFAAASADFQFASAVAGFGMLLRGSQYKGDATFAGMLEIAESAIGDRDSHGYRREFVEMVSQAKRLAGE